MLRNPNNFSRPSNGSTVGSTVSSTTPTLKRTVVSSSSPPQNNTSNNASSSSHSTLDMGNAADLARKRQTRKDDAIRKKLDQELGRKRPATRVYRSTTKAVKGTVGSLRPSAALTLPDSAMVVDAARIMAAKRADAVLVIDKDQHLVGIMTDKDLAFRVVAEGLDIRSTLISQVMTRNPFCVTTDTNATEALNKMVSGGFRHLPCLNAEGDVVGLLDITKCLYEALEKLEKAHQSSKKLVDALEGMQAEWAQSANQGLHDYVEAMREKMASPDLNAILDNSHGAAEVQTKTSVREASKVMKMYHSTASLIMEDGRIAGIFTTKDIVVRVMAAGLDPGTTSVIRVMTPHPDTVPASTTILEALKIMHTRHYLHLPVVNEHGEMAGLVDVLQVSLAMLNQMATIQSDSAQSSGSNNQSTGPVWNKFWETTFDRDDTGSDVSASDVRSNLQSDIHYGSPSLVGSSNPIRNGSSTVGSNNRPSTHETNRGSPQHRIQEEQLQQQQQQQQQEHSSSPPPQQTPSEFTFKFKEPIGDKVHRFTSSSRSYSELFCKIQEKIGGSAAEATLSYFDEENDQVLLSQDSDVEDAVEMAARNQWALIRLVVTLKHVPPPPVVETLAAEQVQEPIVQKEVDEVKKAQDEEEIASSPVVTSTESLKTSAPAPIPTAESAGTGGGGGNGLLSIIQATMIDKVPAGVDPLVATGAIGLGVGVGVALLIAMLRK